MRQLWRYCSGVLNIVSPARLEETGLLLVVYFNYAVCVFNISLRDIDQRSFNMSFQLSHILGGQSMAQLSSNVLADNIK